MDETDWTQTLAQRLFEQRVVLLHGPLDDASVARTSADIHLDLPCRREELRHGRPVSAVRRSDVPCQHFPNII